MGTWGISIQPLGRQNQSIADWSVPPPPELMEAGGRGITLRELITHVVRQSVARFQQRQQQNRFLHVLTEPQIRQQAEQGRILSGGRDLDQPVDVSAAIATALLAFQDGLYLVLVDGVPCKELDTCLPVQADSRILFLRLTMLTGG